MSFLTTATDAESAYVLIELPIGTSISEMETGLGSYFAQLIPAGVVAPDVGFHFSAPPASLALTRLEKCVLEPNVPLF